MCPCEEQREKLCSGADRPLPPSLGWHSVTFPECPMTLGPICSISVIICSGTSRAELQEGRVEAFLQLGRLMAALQGSILPKCPGRREERVGIHCSDGDFALFLLSSSER